MMRKPLFSALSCLLLSSCMATGTSLSPPIVISDQPPTRQEYANAYRFETIDLNRDGQISFEEFLDANHTIILNTPLLYARDFQNHDTNRDGFLNRQEHSIWLAKQLEVWS